MVTTQLFLPLDGGGAVGVKIIIFLPLP